MSKVFESKFAMISYKGEIRLFTNTKIYYQRSEKEYILKDVRVELRDDHTIYVKGTPSHGYYTDEAIYVDKMDADFKSKLLPMTFRKSFFKNREFIIGCYALWLDHQMELYLKFDPYRIVVEP